MKLHELAAAIDSLQLVRDTLITDLTVRISALAAPFRPALTLLVATSNMEAYGICRRAYRDSAKNRVFVAITEDTTTTEFELTALATDSLVALELALNSSEQIIENIRSGCTIISDEHEQEMLAAHSTQRIDPHLYSHGDAADPTHKFD